MSELFEKGQTVRASRQYGGKLYTVVRHSPQNRTLAVHEKDAPADFNLVGPDHEFHVATSDDFEEVRRVEEVQRVAVEKYEAATLEQYSGDLAVSLSNALDRARNFRDRASSVAQLGYRDDDKDVLRAEYDALKDELEQVVSYFSDLRSAAYPVRGEVKGE